MKNSESITVFQLTLLGMTAVGFNNHVIVIPPLIQAAGRDSWMSVLISFGFILIWSFLFVYIHKKTRQQHLFLWLQQHIGKFFSIVIVISICLYVVILAASTLRETIIWANIVFLPATPVWILAFLFILLCVLTAASGLRTLSIINVFLLFFIIILGFFVATANLQFKDYSLILPLLEKGYSPVFKASIYAASGMIELVMFLFLQQKIDAPIRYRHFLVNALLLTGLTLGPLLGAIAEFGPVEASRQRYPAYEEWGLVQLGQFVEHVDYLSIYQWMSGAFIRVSLLLFILLEILNLKDKRKVWWILLPVFAVLMGLTLFPVSDMQSYKFLKSILLPSLLVFVIGLSVLLGGIVIMTRNKGGRQPNG